MDEFARKRYNLTRAREEAERWLNPEGLTDVVMAYHTGEAKRFQTKISSEEYVRDHEGYVLALGHLQAHQNALASIGTAQARLDQIVKELKKLDEEEAKAA